MDDPSVEPYRLQLLGPWDLRGPDDTVVRSLLSQPKRLCLLAYLALSGEPIARSKIVALFWPESDEERARNALNQAVHYLRRSLTKDAVRSVEGDRVWVPREVVWFDAREVLEGRGEGVWGAGGDRSAGGAAGAAGDEAGENGVASGEQGATGNGRPLDAREFFDGWNAEDSQPLQEWLDGVRRRVAEVRAAASVRVGGSSRDALGEEAHEGRGALQADEGAGADSQGGSGPPRATSSRKSVLPFLLAASLAALIAVGLGWTDGRADDPPANGIAEVAVLMPRVFASGDGPSLTGDFVHEELVARLSRSDAAVIKSIRTVGSVADFVGLLEAQGAEDRPAWAVTVSVRLVDGRARVIATLLRGPDYANTPDGRVWDYDLESDEYALMDLPRLIAVDVAEAFAGWIEGDPRR